MGSIALRQHAVPWQSQHTKLKPRTADLHPRRLNLHVPPQLGDRPFKGLTPAAVRAWDPDLRSTTATTAQTQSHRLLRADLPKHKGEARWSLGGEFVAGLLFSHQGARLAAQWRYPTGRSARGPC